MSAGRRGTSKPSRRGPALGVSQRQKVRTAGGQLDQWWTPPWLADLFVAWAGVTARSTVLDAGAGQGAIALAALAHGADVVCVERDSRHADTLESQLGHRARIICADFLAVRPESVDSDVVLMNPPWSGDHPERFVAHALEMAPRVCAILPVNVLFGVGRAEYWLRQPIRIARARALASRPRFRGSRGGMRDVIFLEARHRAILGPQRFELEVGDA